MNQRPAGVTVVCVLAIVLGALGLLTVLSGVARIVAAPEMEDLFSGMPGRNAEVTKLRAEMNAEMMAVAQSRPTLRWSLYFVQVMVACALLAGGVLAVMLKPAGRLLLLGAFAAAIVFELVRIVPMLIITQESMAIVEQYIPRLAEASNQGGPRPGDGEALEAIAKAISIGAFVTLIAMTLFKCVFYVVGALYLIKPRIAALYAQADEAAGGQGE